MLLLFTTIFPSINQQSLQTSIHHRLKINHTMANVEEIENEETLSDILKRVQAILDCNENHLKLILDRKGEDVVTHRTLSLEEVNARVVAQISNIDDINNSAFIGNDRKHKKLKAIVEKRTMKPVDDLVQSWNYRGEELEKEKIIIGDFIDLQLKTYDDVKRLHPLFIVQHEKYSRMFVDQPLSREAAGVLLSNVQKLQIAIREIHRLTVDVADAQIEDKI